MNIDFDLIRKTIETLSYLAPWVLVVVAIKGLSQLRIARKAISYESKRDSLKVGHEQILAFFNTFLPMYEQGKNNVEEQKLLKYLAVDEDNGLDFKQINKNIASGTKLKTKDSRVKYLNNIKLIFEKRRQSFNILEAFSSSFTSGLADEKSAYVALGKTYTKVLESYIPAIKFFNGEGYYNNILTLYQLWTKRLSREAISREVVSLEQIMSDAQSELDDNRKRFKKVKTEISEIEEEKIISVGTEE